MKCKTHETDYFTVRCPACIHEDLARFNIWKMVGTMCVDCRRVFVGTETFKSHWLKIKNPAPGEPRYRHMTEKEFADGGYTRLPDGEYIGGQWPGWGVLNDYQRTVQ